MFTKFNNFISERIENSQILYHSTKYNFLKFDTKNIGGGEGNQSFGYGLYFTDNEDVAKFYANVIGGNEGIVYTVKIDKLNIFDWYDKIDNNTKYQLVSNFKKLGIKELPIKRILTNSRIELIKEPLEKAIEYYPNGKFLYENLSLLFGSDKLASEKLSEIGFDGICYPMSQMLKVGDRFLAKGNNYVLFSGDKVNIIKTDNINKS